MCVFVSVCILYPMCNHMHWFFSLSRHKLEFLEKKLCQTTRREKKHTHTEQFIAFKCNAHIHTLVRVEKKWSHTARLPRNLLQFTRSCIWSKNSEPQKRQINLLMKQLNRNAFFFFWRSNLVRYLLIKWWSFSKAKPKAWKIRLNEWKKGKKTEPKRFLREKQNGTVKERRNKKKQEQRFSSTDWLTAWLTD